MAQREVLDDRAAEVAAEHARPARGRARRAPARTGRARALGTSWKPSGPTSLSPKPRRSGTITSKPASASGSITFQKIRLVSGQPCTHSSGTPPGLTRTNAWRKPRGAACSTAKRAGSRSASIGVDGRSAPASASQLGNSGVLDDDLRDAYLRHLGLDPEPPSVDALGQLLVAHLDGVPFETTSIRARRASRPRRGDRSSAHRPRAPRRLSTVDGWTVAWPGALRAATPGAALNRTRRLARST